MTANPEEPRTADRLAKDTANSPVTDHLYSDREAAELLACGRSTLWRWASEGVIPKPLKIGGVSRWKFSDLQSVIAKAEEQRQAA